MNLFWCWNPFMGVFKYLWKIYIMKKLCMEFILFCIKINLHFSFYQSLWSAIAHTYACVWSGLSLYYLSILGSEVLLCLFFFWIRNLVRNKFSFHSIVLMKSEIFLLRSLALSVRRATVWYFKIIFVSQSLISLTIVSGVFGLAGLCYFPILWNQIGLLSFLVR